MTSRLYIYQFFTQILYLLSYLFSIVILSFAKYGHIPEIYLLYIYISFPIYLLTSLFLRGASIFRLSILNISFRLFLIILITFTIMSSFTFSLKFSDSLSRLLIFQALSITLLINLFVAILSKQLFKKQSDSNENIALVLPSKRAEEHYLHNNKDFDAVIYYDEGIDKVRSAFKRKNITSIYFYLQKKELSNIDDVLEIFSEDPIKIFWILPKLNIKNSFYSFKNSIKDAIPLTINKQDKDWSQLLAKKLTDLFFGLTALVFFIPICILIALLIKITDLGPVFFLQERHGLNGKKFKMYKFRSMKVHDDSSVVQAKKNDYRLTWIGKIIRKTSLDEVPQILNVLKGDMSLVGPRPHAVAHNDYYSTKIKNYMHRHRVVPGMTGLAQIKGYRGGTEDIKKMESRIRHDLYYINNWSISFDFKILFLTPIELIKNIRQTY